jgi:antitoxin (DNA-binding transcriptional repressor) of toxin-antitoxin stability system
MGLGPVPWCSTCATLNLPQRISQRELRSESGRIMRALDRGESFTVTRNGVPVGELAPLKPRVFVPADTAVRAFRHVPLVSGKRLRRDLDALVSQDPTPRG